MTQSCKFFCHYNDVIMGKMASQITSLTIVYSTVYSDADQRKHQSSALLAICAGNSPVTGEFPAQMSPVNSPHKWPVTRKMFPFDDVIMVSLFSDIASRILVHNTTSECCIKVTIRIYGCCQAISSKSSYQIRMFPLCVPDIPNFCR